MENVDVGARVPLLLLRTSTRFCGFGTAGGNSLSSIVAYVLGVGCSRVNRCKFKATASSCPPYVILGLIYRVPIFT
jgi:hypothetical protein